MEIPNEILFRIAMNLSYQDVLNLCTAEPKFAWLCEDELLWKQKTLQDFGKFYRYTNMWKYTYEEVYLILYGDSDIVKEYFNNNPDAFNYYMKLAIDESSIEKTQRLIGIGLGDLSNIITYFNTNGYLEKVNTIPYAKYIIEFTKTNPGILQDMSNSPNPEVRKYIMDKMFRLGLTLKDIDDD